MKAIISDIHGNLEALQAVLEDIKSHSIEEIYCLGDIVGYGPNPRECVDLVMEKCSVVILGNHDQEPFRSGRVQCRCRTGDFLDPKNAGIG
ncbi:MAG: metallophosphoesterase family protein [Planctomycetaceae bacterium]